MNTRASNVFVFGCRTAAAILIAGTMSLVISPPAHATAQFAQQTGKPCAQCHQNPTGGTELTPFGQKFEANGNKLPKENAPSR